MKKILKDPVLQCGIIAIVILLIIAIFFPDKPKIVSVYDGNTLIAKYENVIIYPIDDGKSYYFYDEDGTKVIINGDIIKISDM